MSSNRFVNEPPVLGNQPPLLSNELRDIPVDPPQVEKPCGTIPEIVKSTAINEADVAIPVDRGKVASHSAFQSAETPVVLTKPVSRLKRILRVPFSLLARSLDLFSLLVLIAIVAAIPLLQFISLGYLLDAGGRLADGRPWRQCLPGLRLAGKIGVFVLWAGLLSLPVVLVADLAQSAQLLEPNSRTSASWRIGAFLLTAAWLGHVGWAAMRGGRWWHFLWPAPLRFAATIWRPSTWNRASDQLYDLVAGLQLPRLWWQGARATVGALLWLVIPVSMMIIGQRAQTPIAPLFGLVGAMLMAWVMFYLPFFQLLFAQSGSMSSFLAIGQVRRNYSFAPWAHSLALVLLSSLAIPLYLLRIEATPSELTWLPSLVFALLMLPTKLILGWAIGYSQGRQTALLQKRAWWSRLPAKLVGFAAVAFYVGALYVAQLIAAQGAYVMYFQHAFLVPNPLFLGN